MHLFLHIGTEKTGSTSIQHHFTAHTAHFRARGVLYPTELHEAAIPRHRGLSAFALDPGILHLSHRMCGVNDVAEIPAFRHRFAARLQAAVSGSRCDKLILSDETCASRLQTRAEVETLRELVATVAERITVVLFVRNPVELAESKYVAAVMGGYHALFPWPLPPNELRALDPLQSARLWGSVFGAENLVVRHYRSRSRGGDAVEDFEAILGLDPQDEPAPHQPRPAANKSISRTALAFLVRLNQILPAMLVEGPNPDRDPVVDALRSYADETRFRLSADIAREISAQLRPSLESLVNEFLGGDPGTLLDEDLGQRTEEPDDLSLHPDDAVRIAAHLWRYQQQRLRVGLG